MIGSGDVIQVLGKTFGNSLMSDFYPVYSKFPVESKNVNPTFYEMLKRLHKILQEPKKFYKTVKGEMPKVI